MKGTSRHDERFERLAVTESGNAEANDRHSLWTCHQLIAQS